MMDEHAQTVGNFLDGRHAKAAARIAALEAELARAEDALRQANGVRDTFALALVGLVDKGGNLQGHQVDKTMNSQVPNDDEVICPNCVHQFRAIPCNVQAELAESDDRARRLAEWLDAERARREAAEAALRQVSLSAAWNSGAQDKVRAHFACYKD